MGLATGARFQCPPGLHVVLVTLQQSSVTVGATVTGE